jgi:hypothetical protein
MIYDANRLAKQVLDKTITMEQARILGDSLVNDWASQTFSKSTLMTSVD